MNVLKLTKPPQLISIGENSFWFYEKFKNDSEDSSFETVSTELVLLDSVQTSK